MFCPFWDYDAFHSMRYWWLTRSIRQNRTFSETIRARLRKRLPEKFHQNYNDIFLWELILAFTLCQNNTEDQFVSMYDSLSNGTYLRFPSLENGEEVCSLNAKQRFDIFLTLVLVSYWILSKPLLMIFYWQIVPILTSLMLFTY